MLFARDFLLLAAAAAPRPMSMVAFSWSAPLRGDAPLMDFRDRRVAGRVASPEEAMMFVLQNRVVGSQSLLLIVREVAICGVDDYKCARAG